MKGKKEMSLEISIIIPVYNTEKYIIECLESVKAQTVSNYEVILVNDGSTDNSAELIANYISKNNLSHFHLINKENGGVSSARNVGLSRAQGKWVLFFDSDDWVEPNCLQELLSVADESGADLIIGGYQAYNQGTGHSEVWSHYPCDSGRIPEDMHNLYSFSFSVARLFKKAIIDEHQLRLDERIKYAEDNAWQLDYVSHIKSFAYTHEVIYTYRINTGEQLTSRTVTPMMKRHRWEHLQSFLAKYDTMDVDSVLSKNPRFLSVVWGILTDAVILDILDNKYKEAKEKLKSPFSKSVITAFSPRSKKESFFLFLWKYSFLLLCVFVKVYYGNFEHLRKSKLLKLISKRK
jgi:glycosyltransferase involved in cell wall biosynthesis